MWPSGFINLSEITLIKWVNISLSQFTALHTRALSLRSKGIMFGAASRKEPVKCAPSGLGAVAWRGSISCHRIYGECLPMDVCWGKCFQKTFQNRLNPEPLRRAELYIHVQHWNKRKSESLSNWWYQFQTVEALCFMMIIMCVCV